MSPELALELLAALKRVLAVYDELGVIPAQTAAEARVLVARAERQ